MKVLVTGSSGHLGQALGYVLPKHGIEVVGLDIRPDVATHHVGSISDPETVALAMSGVDAVLHTATLHKPHIGTHSQRQFVDVNVTGTLTLLEEAVRQNVSTFVFTSTTSAFGAALNPVPGEPAAWIDEAMPSVPKNIYGATKTAAEDLCELFQRRDGLNVLVLRTSRFFPEADDNAATRSEFADENAKANEFLYRRLDVEDVVSAHLAALQRAPEIGFGRYVLSATTPFTREMTAALAANPHAVVAELFPRFAAIYARRGYRMFPRLDRVYDNGAARRDLGWQPQHDFAAVLDRLDRDAPILSTLAQQIGARGYHDEVFADGPYPVTEKG